MSGVDRQKSASGPTGTEYDIKRMLGKGNYGAALEAVRKSDNAVVVIKTQTGQRMRAESERRVMQSLVHPNIVRLLDYWVTRQPRPVLNLVLEYCDGGDLREAINQRAQEEKKGFPDQTIRLWTAQLICALYYCHTQHILHRDLKAENVLLHEGNVKVCDFGFSRMLTGTTDFASTQLGSPSTIAPEVLAHSPYNSRADMWSLGVIIYELMTLSRPFDGPTLQDLFHAIQSQPTPPMNHLPYSEDLKDIVRVLLNKNPMRRPSSAELLQLPWVQETLDFAFTQKSLSSQRLRERQAWRKIRVRALRPTSVMREMCAKNVSVCRREKPNVDSRRLGILAFGDVVEEVDRQRVAEVVWYKLVEGYCIANDPNRGSAMFRAIPEWRVVRPGRQTSPEPEGVQQDHPQQCEETVSTNDADDIDRACDLVSEAFYRGPTSDGRDLLPLRKFLAERLESDVVTELLEEYRVTSTPGDDMGWTIFASDKLRPLGRISCIQVLRTLAIRAMEGEKNEVETG